MAFKTTKYNKGNQMNLEQPEKGSYWYKFNFLILTLIIFVAVTIF